MDVQRVYITNKAWRVSAEKSHHPDEPPYVYIQSGSTVSVALQIGHLEDLLVALHAAKDDLKHLLAKQEIEQERKK